MALNPPLYQAGMPMSVSGELFLLKRESITAEFSVDGLPKLKSPKGSIFLTTLRVVYVCDKPVITPDGATFQAFDLPLKLMHNEKFNQPILGANNLTGIVDPIPGMGLPGPAHFKLTFKIGNATTFLHLFIRAISELRARLSKPEKFDAQKSLSFSINSGSFKNEAKAYQDPSDPSVLFMSQPDIPVAEVYEVPGGEDSKSAGATVVPVTEGDENAKNEKN